MHQKVRFTKVVRGKEGSLGKKGGELGGVDWEKGGIIKEEQKEGLRLEGDGRVEVKRRRKG